MSENTKIEWCDYTFNPWIGCTRVSEGCRNCYAERMAGRFGVSWGPSGVRRRTAGSTWDQLFRWNRRAYKAGVTRSVFPSMCDPFDPHPGIRRAWRGDFGRIINHCEDLEFLLLTKRPENIGRFLPDFFSRSGIASVPCNVRIGVSVEDQATVDQRIPELLRQWDGPNFVSYEPALGAIDFVLRGKNIAGWDEDWKYDVLRGKEWANPRDDSEPASRSINWIIAGGESGPGARPAHPDWFRSVRDQCLAAGVAFFMKQWGVWAPTGIVWSEARTAYVTVEGKTISTTDYMAGRSADLSPWRMARIGKKRAGRLLDGREWNEFPDKDDAK